MYDDMYRYVPAVVFPFVKLFAQHDQLAATEVVITLVTNWLSDWFEGFPNPPMTLLNTVWQYQEYAHCLLPAFVALLLVTAVCGVVTEDYQHKREPMTETRY